jgi:MFS family permease
MVCVPLLSLSTGLVSASVLYNGERFGKAVRTPARDIMLAHASAAVGRGKAFGLHEAMDSLGGLAGPLAMAAVLALGGSYRLGFAVLAIPGAMALVVLARLRAAVPSPRDYEPDAHLPESKHLRFETRLPGRFWLYSAFSAATMLGFSTWGVLAYHLTVENVVRPSIVPVLYAAAMGTAGLAAVAFGRLYDAYGMRGLLLMPVAAAIVPVLSFSTSVAAVIVGAVVWGGALGVHESTMRAAVTDLVPPARRGAGFGTYTAIYGLAWLAGSVAIGALYPHGRATIVVVVGAVQVVAMALLLVLLATAPSRRPQAPAASPPAGSQSR